MGGEYAVVVNNNWKTAIKFHTVGFINGFEDAKAYYDDLCKKGGYKTVEMYKYTSPVGRQTAWYWSIYYTTDVKSDCYRNVAKKKKIKRVPAPFGL